MDMLGCSLVNFTIEKLEHLHVIPMKELKAWKALLSPLDGSPKLKIDFIQYWDTTVQQACGGNGHSIHASSNRTKC
jgi:hypothetical protein